MFRCPTWIRLNLGELTRAEAELVYQAELGLTREETDKLFFHVMDHQELIDGTEVIARRLKDAGYRVFGLTDNVREIVAHLKSRHQFWDLFEGAVVSAEIGLMKPNPAIFRHLLEGVLCATGAWMEDHREAQRRFAARLGTTPHSNGGAMTAAIIDGHQHA